MSLNCDAEQLFNRIYLFVEINGWDIPRDREDGFREIKRYYDLAKSCGIDIMNYVSSTKYNNETLLNMAITNRTSDMDVIKFLLDLGADPNLSDRLGDTPLILATRYSQHSSKYADFIKLLIEYGADLNIPGSSGKYAIHQAILSGTPEILAVLLEYGANPNVLNSTEESPLDYAVCRIKPEKMIILIEYGAELLGQYSLHRDCLEMRKKAEELIKAHQEYRPEGPGYHRAFTRFKTGAYSTEDIL